MRSSSARWVIVMLGAVLSFAAAWAIARPGPFPPPYVVKCPQPACTDVCDMSQHTIGYCTQGKNGSPFAATYECCCCGEGTKSHWFHGE